MKKVTSVVLSFLLILPMVFHVAAAEYTKMRTTQETTVYERASTKSDVIATVKEGYRFTPVGATKSYWKIEYKQADTIVTGYILKKHAEERTAVATSQPQSQAQARTQTQTQTQPQSRTVYWVPNGKVYHSTASCSTLSRSNTIYSGSVSESGKERGCKVCY